MMERKIRYENLTCGMQNIIRKTIITMKKARTSYNLEFKISAAKMSIHCGSIANVADELNISRNTLEHWRKAYKDGRLTLKRSAGTEEAKNEILRLRMQIKELRIERDILKKALSIFSKKDG